ncbi:alpha-dioxygenase 1-like protein, partial [Tanacetum coccineum]
MAVKPGAILPAHGIFVNSVFDAEAIGLAVSDASCVNTPSPVVIEGKWYSNYVNPNFVFIGVPILLLATVGSLMVDQEAIETLPEMYDGDVENLDLLVGMSSEKKTKEFVNRETTFIFFLIMTS